MINRGAGSRESFTALPSAELRSTAWLPQVLSRDGGGSLTEGTWTLLRGHSQSSVTQDGRFGLL